MYMKTYTVSVLVSVIFSGLQSLDYFIQIFISVALDWSKCMSIPVIYRIFRSLFRCTHRFPYRNFRRFSLRLSFFTSLVR